MADTTKTIAQPPRRFWKRKGFYIPAVAVAMFVLLVGPWPIYTSSYQDTGYSQATFDRVDALPTAGKYGPLQVGTASRDITPPVGGPMAGFGGRKPNTSEGISQHVYAKAITLSAGGTTVTIVGGDILLVVPSLRDEILRRTGLPREAVYFTATHTHSGPGGYSSRWVDQLVLGKFDQAIFDKLAGDFANVILESRKNLSNVDFSAYVTDCSDLPIAVNRMDRNAPAMNLLYRLSFIKDNLTSELYIASAHATCYGSSNRQINGDYPGALQERLKTECSFSMFAAGAVGSMTPPSDKPHGHERANNLAWRITCPIWPVQCDSPIPQNVLIQSQILSVDLPVQQYRVTQGMRLSPIGASYLHGRQTCIHVLRIRRENAISPADDIVLLGMPADYSGELALRLADQCRDMALTPIVTSFNGDYIGYLLPQERYWIKNSETMDENLFGPWCGEYFNEICLRLLKRMQAKTAVNAPSSSSSSAASSLSP